MSATKLDEFAKTGICQREGSAVLLDKTLKQSGYASEVRLPSVSTSTGAAVTAVIRL